MVNSDHFCPWILLFSPWFWILAFGLFSVQTDLGIVSKIGDEGLFFPLWPLFRTMRLTEFHAKQISWWHPQGACWGIRQETVQICCLTVAAWVISVSMTKFLFVARRHAFFLAVKQVSVSSKKQVLTCQVLCRWETAFSLSIKTATLCFL